MRNSRNDKVSSCRILEKVNQDEEFLCHSGNKLSAKCYFFSGVPFFL